jgi:glycosyltransferase involved in cell wall biosynthesis
MSASAIAAAPPGLSVPRLALLRDFPEEAWPSMDLCGEMLGRHLRGEHDERLTVVDLCPRFRRRLQRLPWLGRRRAAFNGDRMLNRFWDFPRYLRHCADEADLYHVVDHSYAQLVHVLPSDRVGVYCHDLDTFRCLLAPAEERRPRWFRAVARRVLDGLRKAAVVFHSTHVVRAAIQQHGLVDPARLVHAPLGAAPDFQPEGRAHDDATGKRMTRGMPYLLHVGSCIPRKRIDVLLDVFGRLRERWCELHLVKVGGEWSAGQRTMLARPALADAVIHVTGISRRELAALYRRATLVMMPSEAEGFGLPVIEALACGAPVLASDLPVFREVGGDAVHYVTAGDVDAWTETTLTLVRRGDDAACAQHRIARAERFSWRRHARIIADAYANLAQCRNAGFAA